MDASVLSLNSSTVLAKNGTSAMKRIENIMVGDEENRNDESAMNEDEDGDELTQSEDSQDSQESEGSVDGVVPSDYKAEEDDAERAVRKQMAVSTRSRRNSRKKKKGERVAGKKRKRDREYEEDSDSNPKKKARLEDTMQTPEAHISG